MAKARKSKTGFCAQAVEAAFRQAQDELGSNWRLTGRGYRRRVTLQSHYVRPACKGARASYGIVSIGRSPRTVWPYELVVRAAEILGIPDTDMRGCVDEQSYHQDVSVPVVVQVDTVPAANPRWQRPVAAGKRR